MRTLRFIGFIPSFFITAFLLNLLYNFVSGIFGFENNLDKSWFLLLVKPFIIISMSTNAAIEIYPNDSKKPAIISVGVILILSCIFNFYFIQLVSELAPEHGVEFNAGMSTLKQIVISVVSFIGFLFTVRYVVMDGEY